MSHVVLLRAWNLGQPRYATMSLALLPAELLHATLSHLAPKDLAAVAAASRALKAAAYDERLFAAALLERHPWHKCGLAISAPTCRVGGLSARTRFAFTNMRCAHCLQRMLPVQQQSHGRLQELRRVAQSALSLSRDQCAQITAFCKRITGEVWEGASVAVWPSRHGTRVWVALQSRLEGEKAVEELKLLCSRDVEGWTPIVNSGSDEKWWRWDTAVSAQHSTVIEWAEVEHFLVEAITASDRGRYVPPLRASTVEARLQLEMRAKTVALERVLLDGDCVFGFYLDLHDCFALEKILSPMPMQFSGVMVCQRSSARELRLANRDLDPYHRERMRASVSFRGLYKIKQVFP